MRILSSRQSRLGVQGIIILFSYHSSMGKTLQEHQSVQAEAEKGATTFEEMNTIFDLSSAPDLNTIDRIRTNERPIYELTTTYEGGWVQDGIMFDVRTSGEGALSNGIVVRGLDILTPVENETLCVELYTRSGGYEGFDTDPSSWDFLGSFSLLGRGKDTPTQIPIGCFEPVIIGPNSSQGFYVTTQNENMRYTAYNDSAQTHSVFASSFYGGVGVEILMGVAKNYPFDQSWSHRMFNGAIHYNIGNNSDLESILNGTQDANVQYIKRGLVTCDVNPPDLSTQPSTNVVVASFPTLSPVAYISQDPSETPSFPPTALEFTIKKVATTLHGGLKQAGVMFDIRVPTVQEGGPSEGLTVLSFEVSTLLSEEICVEVYSKDGTHVGYESDIVRGADGLWSSASWSGLGAATANGMGEETPTNLPIGSLDPTYIRPGQTCAFYVTMTVPEMRYTEPEFGEMTGDVFVTTRTGHLELLVGTAMSYPFLDSWPNRIFNGAVVYALGDVADGKYSEATINDRNRFCPRSPAPTVSPSGKTTTSPIRPAGLETTTESTGYYVGNAVVSDDTSDSVDNTSTPGTEEASVSAEAPGVVETANELPVERISTSSTAATFAPLNVPRLDGTCLFEAGFTDTRGWKDIVVEYKYSLVTNLTEHFKKSVPKIENLVHTELMASKCSETSKMRNDLTIMQGTIIYYGFNSNPSDEIVEEKCITVNTLSYEQCSVVQGGLTATVQDDADESMVHTDLVSFVHSVLSHAAKHDSLGVNSVAVESSVASPTRGDVNGAMSEDQGHGSDSVFGGLNTTNAIITAVVTTCVALALMFLIASRRHKKTTRRVEASGELFQEFSDEIPQHELGLSYGVYTENGNRHVDKSLFLHEDEEPEFGNSPVILNEHDEVSLVSNEWSKFATTIPGTPSSNTSNGSVKFVRAGASFSSRSHQPEDTVDL